MERKNTIRLSRKPSKKIPMVKQTKGSLLRIIKANPLIAIDEKIKKDLGITDEELKRLGHIGLVRETMELGTFYNKNKEPSTSNDVKLINPSKNEPENNLRRSVSAENYNVKSHIDNNPRENIKTHSEENINQNQQPQTEFFHFKTPQKQKPFFATPSTINTPSRHLYTSTPVDIKVKLNTWLGKHGKSVGTYHHLKCFGIKLEEIEEEKENIEQPKLTRSESYKALNIIPETNIENPPIINYDLIARDALNDLFKLIQDGYSPQQCTEWLNMIKEKCKNIDEEPTYWECRAALEERNENISTAIMCYRTAILKGAEVKNVDESVDLLLEKFNLLNIDSNINNKEESTKRKMVIEAKNVFKSTIIQFAVCEKDKKKKDDSKLIITPVRRSARLSGCITPRGVKLCTSFKEVEGFENNEKVDFKSNKFLSVRYN